MADSSFEQIVNEDRLACLTSKAKFAVNKGAQNISASVFKAISATTSSCV